MSSSLKIVPATDADVPAMAKCVLDAFIYEPQPQAKFFVKCFPLAPSTLKWLEASLGEQIRTEPNAVFLKAVDTNNNDEMAGFIKWGAPGDPESYWADYGEDMDAGLCDAFFGAMAQNRATMMGGQPHWYLELLAISKQYQRKGAGSLLIDHGCKLADRDGLEAYVDASPAGLKLYERYGFVSKNTEKMPEPYDWYVENFMVRPKK